MKKIFLPLFFLLLISTLLYSQNFSGRFILRYNDQEIILKLNQNSDGSLTGNMNSPDAVYNISGKLKENKIYGLMESSEGSIKYIAKFSNENLQVTFFDPQVDEPEDDVSAETLTFNPLKKKTETNKYAQNPPGKTKSSDANNNKVIINNISLSEKQINEIEKIYSIRPLPGNYWYDPRSGLYGVVGFPAYGFMYAGHNFGKLDPKASNGNTGVFVNGRELPQQEWLVWSGLLGYYIPLGRYWLADNGDAGYEGNPVPTDNLYAAAKRNSYAGSGSGDHTWSTRFSAGNYDKGNQRGYVSVPGYGPIGYGF